MIVTVNSSSAIFVRYDMEYGVSLQASTVSKTELENLSSMAFHMLRRGRAVSPYVTCPHDPAPSAGSWGGLSGARAQSGELPRH